MNAPGTPGTSARVTRRASASATPARKRRVGFPSSGSRRRVPFFRRRISADEARPLVARRRQEPFARRSLGFPKTNKRVLRRGTKPGEPRPPPVRARARRRRRRRRGRGAGRDQPVCSIRRGFFFRRGGFGSGEDELRRNLRDRACVRPGLEQQTIYPHRIPRAGGVHGQNLPRLSRFPVRVAPPAFLTSLFSSRRACFLLLDECFTPSAACNPSHARGSRGSRGSRARRRSSSASALARARSARACASRRVNSVAARWSEVSPNAPELFRFTSARSPKSPRSAAATQRRVSARDRDVQHGTHARDVVVQAVHVLTKHPREQRDVAQARRAVKRRRRIERVRYRAVRARASPRRGRLLSPRPPLPRRAPSPQQPATRVASRRPRDAPGRSGGSPRRRAGGGSRPRARARGLLFFLFRFRFRSRRDLSARRVRGATCARAGTRTFRAGRAARLCARRCVRSR